MKTPKPTKTQAEIAKLEKKILKLSGDLEAKRKLEQLRARAAELEAQLEAKPEEPCKRQHYSPCLLPNSPFWFQPHQWNHGWDCKCSSCRPTMPVWVGSPVITCTDGIGTTTTVTPGTGTYTFTGATAGDLGDTTSIFNVNNIGAASGATNLMIASSSPQYGVRDNKMES